MPALLLLGASVVPATFTTFIDELQVPRTLPFARIATAAVLGGVIGAVVAGQLECETVRELGSLPTVLIGLIEESAKLAVPAAMLAWQPRLTGGGPEGQRGGKAMDGVVLGVAVGSGFAALETMGYPGHASSFDEAHLALDASRARRRTRVWPARHRFRAVTWSRPFASTCLTRCVAPSHSGYADDAEGRLGGSTQP